MGDNLLHIKRKILRLHEECLEEESRRQLLLDLIDENGETLFQFPEISALSDLLQAVQCQVAGVGSFLDEIFNEEA